MQKDKLGILSTAGGKEVIDVIKKASIKDKAKIHIVLEQLKQNGVDALSNFNTKTIENPVKEIKVGSWRIFYFVHNEIVYLLHITYKQKNKTEKIDREKAIKLSKAVINGTCTVVMYH